MYISKKELKVIADRFLFSNVTYRERNYMNILQKISVFKSKVGVKYLTYCIS